MTDILIKHFDFPSVDGEDRKIYVWMYPNGTIIIERDGSLIKLKIDDLMHILQMYPFPIKLTSEMEGLIEKDGTTGEQEIS